MQLKDTQRQLLIYQILAIHIKLIILFNLQIQNKCVLLTVTGLQNVSIFFFKYNFDAESK